MTIYYLQFMIKSDAAFGRGDGVAGIIDSEVQYDDLGCPFLSGKEIKGILAQECAGILAGIQDEDKQRQWKSSARRLFGQAGSTAEDTACLDIGDARLPEDLIKMLNADRAAELAKEIADMEIADKNIDKDTIRRNVYRKFRAKVLSSLTTIRQQTAIDDVSGIAREHSLRSTRVIIRETPFTSRLEYHSSVEARESDADIALLAVCIAAFRRAGAKRNRGHGRLEAELLDDQSQTVQQKYLNNFAVEVLK